jgi:hypothetical protein
MSIYEPRDADGVPLRVGRIAQLGGFITRLSAILGQGPAEVATRLGYGAGRLDDGYLLCEPVAAPALNAFERRGYSHFPGGRPSGEALTTEQLMAPPPGAHPIDVARYWRARLEQLHALFHAARPDSPCKVAPLRPGSAYPPGSGVPQWELTKPIGFRVVLRIGPAQKACLHRGALMAAQAS